MRRSAFVYIALLGIVAFALALGSCGGGGISGDDEKSHFEYPTRIVRTPDSEDPDGVFLYVLNSLNGTVSVVDVAENDNDVVYGKGKKEEDGGDPDDVLDVGDFPVDLAITPDGSRVYSCNAQPGFLYVLDTATYEISQLELDVGPCAMTSASGADGRAFVYIVDPAGLRAVALDTVEEDLAWESDLGAAAVDVVASADGSALLVTTEDGFLLQLDAATGAVEEDLTLELLGSPGNMALSPQGDLLYVLNSEPSSLQIVDPADMVLVSEVFVEGLPADLAVTPDSGFVYVTDVEGNAIVFDVEKGHFCGASASEPVFIDRDKSSNPVMSAVTVADCVTQTEDWTVIYDQEEREYVVKGSESDKQTNRAYEDKTYVSDNGEISFFIRQGERATTDRDHFDFSTDAGIEPIRVGLLPDGIAVVPEYEEQEYFYLFVANTGSSNLSILSTEEHENVGHLN